MDGPGSVRNALTPRALAVCLGIVSAFGYTLANTCLREVAPRCAPAWVSCLKAVPVTFAATAMVLLGAWTGRAPWPRGAILRDLVLAALFMQLGGNLPFQWSLGVVGLAVSVPACFSSIIVGGALLGRVCLDEAITARSAAAMAVLVLSMVLLGAAASGAGGSAGAGAASTTAGVTAACLSGVAYAVSSVVLRRTLLSGVSLSSTLVVMSSLGIAVLGAVSVVQAGPEAMLRTHPSDLAVMLLAGTFNAVGFYALAASLRVLTVAHANLINASQVAMSALIGIALFAEPSSGLLGGGVTLTVLGLVLSGVRGRSAASDQ